MEDNLTEVQLAELRRKLSTMSVTGFKDAYQSAFFKCKLEGDKVPTARAIQTLVQWTGDASIAAVPRVLHGP